MNKFIIIILLLFILVVVACDKVTKPEFNTDKSTCNGCGSCIDVCPNDAIEFDSNGKAVIDQTKCIQCARCVPVCPQGAIY
ncbi:MAG: 4Fe-4S binding protein [Candidatus Cloacimonetes bacterium]|nr:4Fe-4S binding protein [Candidatus Cloacimonadota bacterium]